MVYVGNVIVHVVGDGEYAMPDYFDKYGKDRKLVIHPDDSERGKTYKLPSCAMRLLLAEYARLAGMRGYGQLAGGADDGKGNMWTVSRIDEQFDSLGRETRPGMIRLTCERNEFARTDAIARLSRVNSDLADAITRLRGLRSIQLQPQDVQLAAEIKEQTALHEARKAEYERQAEELHKIIKNGGEEHYYFPLDESLLELRVSVANHATV